MKLLADECCDASLVQALRDDGHDVLYAADSLRGLPDTEVLGRAHAEQRLLLTEDKDFGELVCRLRLPAYGIVLLRFDVGDRSAKVTRLTALLRDYGDRLAGRFAVLGGDKVRLRPLR